MWSLNNDMENMHKSPGAPARTSYDVGLRSGQVDKVIFFLST
jgi:hypothetical protein